jgi:hypothetical protein
VLAVDVMRHKVKGLARSDAYRLVTRICEEAVHALKEGKVFQMDSVDDTPATEVNA